MTPRVQCVLPVALLAWCGILPAADLSFLAGLAAEKLKESGTPGAAIAVVQGDRVVYQRAFGVANVQTGEPVKTEMLFRLGSTTKMFTAAAVLALKEQGRVDLSAPISKYVSGLDAKIGARDS